MPPQRHDRFHSAGDTVYRSNYIQHEMTKRHRKNQPTQNFNVTGDVLFFILLYISRMIQVAPVVSFSLSVTLLTVH